MPDCPCIFWGCNALTYVHSNCFIDPLIFYFLFLAEDNSSDDNNDIALGVSL